MGITMWLKNFLSGKIESKYIDGETALSPEQQLAVSVYATRVAVSKVARTVAKCEFRTLAKGKIKKSSEYYLWNVRPNLNQNAIDFKIKLVTQLLLHNEVLVIEQGENIYIAEEFTPHTDGAFHGHYFDRVTINGLTLNKRFDYDDVIYLRLDNEDISHWLSNVLNQYDNLTAMAAGKYKRAGGRKGIARVDATIEGNEGKKQKVDELFTKRFKTYYQSENSVLVLPNGVEYKDDSSEGSKRTASEVNDISNLVRETFCRVAQAFNIPLPLLFGDVADTSGAAEDFISFGITPICMLIATEINSKRYSKEEYLSGTKMMISVSRAQSSSIFKKAAQIDKLVSSGYSSINELKIENGEEPLPFSWADEHYITKNYQSVDSMSGGQET